jgi:hypothetical protein
MTTTENEKFTTESIRAAALKLITSQLDKTTVIYSVESNGERHPVNASACFANSDDEFIVSLEFRTKSFDDVQLTMLDALALTELCRRTTNALLTERDERIAGLEAQLAAK